MSEGQDMRSMRVTVVKSWLQRTNEATVLSAMLTDNLINSHKLWSTSPTKNVQYDLWGA